LMRHCHSSNYHSSPLAPACTCVRDALIARLSDRNSQR
jgi:hypothetical protein